MACTYLYCIERARTDGEDESRDVTLINNLRKDTVREGMAGNEAESEGRR